MHDVASLGREPFVLLTTFRRDGRAVPTPVWIAESGGHLVVSTPAGTGKLKRLRHTPAVTLQACSRRGSPTPGAPVVAATTRVSNEPGVRQQAEAALRRKYGLQWRVAMVVEFLVRRGKTVPRPAILIDPEDSQDLA